MAVLGLVEILHSVLVHPRCGNRVPDDLRAVRLPVCDDAPAHDHLRGIRGVCPASGGCDCNLLRRDGAGAVADELDLLRPWWPNHDLVRSTDPPSAVAERRANATAILQRSRRTPRASRSRDSGVLEHLLRRDRDRDSLGPGERHVVHRVAVAERQIRQLRNVMNATVADLNPKSLDSAKRQFVELYGSALVMNTYLKIALVLVSL